LKTAENLARNSSRRSPLGAAKRGLMQSQDAEFNDAKAPEAL
jgi:hypothetical protein